MMHCMVVTSLTASLARRCQWSGNSFISYSLLLSHIFDGNTTKKLHFDLIRAEVLGVGNISTADDLGTSLGDVEAKLQEILQLAQLWNCVLLLDEADVFVAQRSVDDIEQNALVSADLKYYIHDLIQPEGKEILDYAERLFQDQQKSDCQMGPVWNGRQIRNAFQSAVALAGFKHEGTSKIHLRSEHFKRLILCPISSTITSGASSRAFNVNLMNLGGGNTQMFGTTTSPVAPFHPQPMTQCSNINSLNNKLAFKSNPDNIGNLGVALPA
ncbi:hypothetical protein B0H63DRAFT_446218 [Podospora didyma]|uniref:AAA+ ATPase lid domain-containing protein n=1 Tax=Podospora didyma TaxID=330526 RepID=A0AAE0U425_9PEZI|nr:hypothetical protein B0H63DRAFT_446218 [Podospora didyma]